ncbi:cytochrome P450 [Suillus subalutaceus]|uniref:cytochrome P450 n=1 Tax=Suillus subalutaceus TaxID=48586 RepID=UPI001B87A3BA|nr:cytochrome P450 [Suillus subalutaceus]KAG1840302.1 cytochrome P450 [Suillus subalutaceus]
MSQTPLMWHSPRTILLLTSGVIPVLVFFSRRRKAPNLDDFPTIGCSFGPSRCFSNFYVGAFRFLVDAPGVLKEGYEKYGSRPFKVATMLRWTVVFSDPQHMLEVANAAEEDLSFREAMKDVRPLSSLQLRTIDTALEIMGVDDTLEINIGSPDHDLLAELLKSHIARNATKIGDEVQDELFTSLENVLGNESDEWTSIPVLGTVNRIMVQTWQRFFVGYPLCRNSEWCSLVAKIYKDVAISGVIRRLVPSWTFPFFVKMASSLEANVDRATMLLGPTVEACMSEVDEYSVPNQQKMDFLARLVRRSAGEDSLLRNLTTRLLGFTIAVSSTPSNTFTHALYHLATKPEVAQALRDEVDPIVQREGWNIQSVAKMSKIDSFLRESARINGVSSLGFFRQAMRDLSLSDGTFLPKDCIVAVSLPPFHRDSTAYEAPDEFRPFRFSDNPEHIMTTITPQWLFFGYGKHLCPGRFLLTYQLKVMFAYMISTYDIRFGDEWTSRPPNFIFGEGIVPNLSAHVSYRRRQPINDTH